MKDFKTFVNENLLVPRNLEGRKEKLKQMNIRLLSQEVIDGDLDLDESFMGIDAKFVKLKKVNGDVLLTGEQWTEIPEWLKDMEIEGDFSCAHNKLTTFKNCPQKIGLNFSILYNKITSLEGCPENINGTFSCAYNQLTTLKNGPDKIGRNFWCNNNLLISLEGCAKNIGGDFECFNNQLTSLYGCPENIGGDLWCNNNKVVKMKLPDYVKLKGKFFN